MKQLKRIPVVVLLLVCFLCLAHPNAAQAATTTYTDQTGFNAQLVPGFYNTFTTDVSALGVGALSGSQLFSGGAFDARAASDVLYANAAPGEMSTNGNDINLFFDILAPNVTAVGGDFFSASYLGIADLGPITLTLVTLDPAGDYAQTFTSSSATSFMGFLSPGNPILYLEISAPGNLDDPESYATAMNFEFGNAQTGGGTVPEPATFVLLGAGLIAGGLLRKRLSRV